MDVEQAENTQTTADNAQTATAEMVGGKYERSSIEFPYGDLDDAVGIACAIQSNAGVSCSLSQLAAFVGSPISSGTFRLRVSNARIYGLTENAHREVTLTPLGRRIADPIPEPSARADAFLHVPLYRRIFDAHDGYTLPGPGPLERFMRDAGVSPKQTGKARQAFMRSARQAGFFAHGEDRLVRPSFPAPGTRPIEEGTNGTDKRKGRLGGGGDDGGENGIDPIIRGLLARLPKSGDVWPEAERKLWLDLLAGSFRLIYKDKDDVHDREANIDRS
jgi:hypothetical protein